MAEVTEAVSRADYDELARFASEMWRELKSLGRDAVFCYDYYKQGARERGLEGKGGK